MKLRGSMVAWTLAVLGGLGFAAASPAACSAGASDDDDGAGLNGTGGFAGNMNVGGHGEGGACVAETFPGELAPMDLHFMIDKSSSMQGSKWSSVVSAFNTFADAGESDGIGVGAQFFPLPPTGFIPIQPCADPNDCGLYGPCITLPPPLSTSMCAGWSPGGDTSCDPVDYSGARMPIAELPAAAQTFKDTINAESPNGSATPSQPAMEGAVVYATAWAQANPTHLTYIVFATDGEPTSCQINSIDGTAQAAAAALAGSPSVPTFVIGVGSELGALNQIAQAGGTTSAFLVDTGGNVADQFVQALNEIRAMGVCVFQIPQPGGGEQVDFDRVNVTLVDPDDPSNETTVPYVSNQASCDPVNGGWYYDNTGAPTKIILCPATCDQVRATDWNIQVETGCLTITR